MKIRDDGMMARQNHSQPVKLSRVWKHFDRVKTKQDQNSQQKESNESSKQQDDAQWRRKRDDSSPQMETTCYQVSRTETSNARGREKKGGISDLEFWYLTKSVTKLRLIEKRVGKLSRNEWKLKNEQSWHQWGCQSHSDRLRTPRVILKAESGSSFRMPTRMNSS